ncbi:Protein phosphatase, putative [Hondaea fermentalgiana]|uniref:Protein phosphatase, putative n=1 Tax=Hondaea fermentalgiana TaxID=2315210 RepID=A0A2R5G3G1_9STRA|nr:Protein phosphatase, putative [Hondaea fermentalgiana]|eukprot:GBG25552.1 Protein phosphatase, putative [Hondaea fermentalgiana]
MQPMQQTGTAAEHNVKCMPLAQPFLRKHARSFQSIDRVTERKQGEEESDSEDSDESSIGSVEDLSLDDDALAASLQVCDDANDDDDDDDDTSPRTRPRRSLLARPSFEAIHVHGQGPAATGFAAAKGSRSTMEDRVAIEADTRAVLAGIFDGHGGSMMSHWLATTFCAHLHETLAAEASNETLAPVLLKEAFLNADLELLAQVREIKQAAGKSLQAQADQSLRRCKSQGAAKEDAGSTATVAALFPETRQLVVAWVGDSRAVLCRNGRAVPLTRDHRPAVDADERQRVLDMGGVLSGSGRLFHDLNLSRAMGSFKHKGHDLYAILPPFSETKETDNDRRLQAQNVLSSVPEICDVRLTAEDHFVIIASDGVWDVVENEIAVEICREALHSGATANEAAETLVHHAIRAGSADNLSVAIMCL